MAVGHRVATRRAPARGGRPARTQTADLSEAARRAYAIIDGTLVPIDRVADQNPYYSGKHKRHGVYVQVLADPAGRLVWASPPLPGATDDLTAARTHGLIDTLTSADVMTFADKGYQGAGGSIWTLLDIWLRRLERTRGTYSPPTYVGELMAAGRPYSGSVTMPLPKYDHPRLTEPEQLRYVVEFCQRTVSEPFAQSAETLFWYLVILHDMLYTGYAERFWIISQYSS